MRFIANLSIKQKLNLIVMVTTCVALLFAFAALLAYDVVATRSKMSRDVSIMADMIAANSTAALSFKDPKAADEALGILRADAHVQSAWISDGRGKIFAKYTGPEGNTGDRIPVLFAKDRTWFTSDGLCVSRSIILDGESIGAVFIKRDLHELSSLMKALLTATAIIASLTVLVAFIISSKLQQFISRPILKLAGTVERVSQKRTSPFELKNQDVTRWAFSLMGSTTCLGRFSCATKSSAAIGITLKKK